MQTHTKRADMGWLYWVSAFSRNRGHRSIGLDMHGIMDDYGNLVPIGC